MQAFFDAYNNVENKAETATILVEKYNTVTETILLEQAKKEQMLRNAKYIGIGVGILFVLAIISAIARKKKKKRTRKNRRNKAK